MALVALEGVMGNVVDVTVEFVIYSGLNKTEQIPPRNPLDIETRDR
jgi:hypothetical protein